MTLSNDPEVLEAAMDEYQRLVQPLLAADPALVVQALYQPITSAMFQHMTDSPIKLSDGPVIIYLIGFLWTEPSKDKYYQRKLRHIHTRVEHKVKKLRGFRQWKYWNYAAGWQDVYQDYGDDVYSQLKDVVEEYDPDRLFFYLQGRSFDFI